MRKAFMLIKPNCVQNSGGFVAVKLQQVQATFGDGAGDEGFFRIHKHADAQNKRRQGTGNFRSLR